MYRKDYTEALIFSIDSENTCAIDDALSIAQIEENIFEVGVHITDVSEFVKYPSSINEEAKKRGQSIYLSNDLSHDN